MYLPTYCNAKNSGNKYVIKIFAIGKLHLFSTDTTTFCNVATYCGYTYLEKSM
jgi:hypothetical protein